MKVIVGAKMRRNIYTMTNGRCFYCGLPLEPDRGSSLDAHGRDWLVPQNLKNMALDHKLATQRGGTHNVENLNPACGACNSRKNISTVEEFRLRLALQRQTMPIVFAAEAPPPITRDYLIVVSPEFVRGVIAHNFPGAYRPAKPSNRDWKPRR